jgi:hypothetical protein
MVDNAVQLADELQAAQSRTEVVHIQCGQMNFVGLAIDPFLVDRLRIEPGRLRDVRGNPLALDL